jgi:hypothetical protein
MLLVYLGVTWVDWGIGMLVGVLNVVVMGIFEVHLVGFQSFWGTSFAGFWGL